MARGRTRLGQPDTIFQGILLLLVSCFVFGCMTGGSISAVGEEERPLKIVPTKIPGLDAANIPAGRYIFNDEKGWADFWSTYQKTPVPEFDLKNFTLVTVFLGQKPNPGYFVKLVGATEHRANVVLNLIEYLPSPEMMYAQVIVYPYDAVLIPKTKKEIRFEVVKEVGRP